MGIFTQDDKELIKFWRKYVQIYKGPEDFNFERGRSTAGFGDMYLDEQMTPSGMRVSMKGGDSGLGPYAMSSFTKFER